MKESLGYTDPEIESDPGEKPGIQLENLKLAVLTPISFGDGVDMPGTYAHRLFGKAKLSTIGSGMHIRRLADFDADGYYKDRLTLRQGVVGDHREAMLQTKHKREQQRQFQRGVNYAHKLSNTDLQLGLLTEKGEELIIRSRIKTVGGPDNRLQFINRIEFEVVEGTYSGMARLTYELFEYLAPYIRATYKGDTAGNFAIDPVVGLRFKIEM